MVPRPPSAVATECVDATASPPCSLIACTTVSAALAFGLLPSGVTPGSLTTTLAPLDASRSAYASPTPRTSPGAGRPAPVMTATRLSNRSDVMLVRLAFCRELCPARCGRGRRVLEQQVIGRLHQMLLDLFPLIRRQVDR